MSTTPFNTAMYAQRVARVSQDAVVCAIIYEASLDAPTGQRPSGRHRFCTAH